MEIKTGQIYRHFKGNLYKVLMLAEHSETGQMLVIYQALYGENRIYARPLEMFIEKTDKEKYPDAKQEYRFEEWNGGSCENYEVSYTKSPAENKAVVNNEDILADKLNAFLDTADFSEKLKILQGMKNIITEPVTDTMAYSLDIELNEGSAEEKYEELLSCVALRERYENVRLRN